MTSDTSAESTTPRQILNTRQEKWVEAFEVRNRDGLIISGLKNLLGFRFFRAFYEGFVVWRLKKNGLMHKSMTQKEAECSIHSAWDWYIFWCTTMLVLSYTAAFYSYEFISLIACALCLFRIAEIFSVFVEIHSSKVYETPNPVRAVVNTFWHYFEVTLIFAVFYLAISRYGLDFFSNDKNVFLHANFFDPFYFSFVTITTLGYGDFSPTTPVGKIVVCSELGVGIMIIVLVIGRALAAARSNSDSEQ